MSLDTQRCDNIVTTLSDVATKMQPKPDVVTSSCTSWEDLEKLDRNLRLKMNYQDEPAPSFLETPAFRPSSNCKQLIRGTPSELYLIETRDELLKINEDGKIYLSLSKENIVHYKI